LLADKLVFKYLLFQFAEATFLFLMREIRSEIRLLLGLLLEIRFWSG